MEAKKKLGNSKTPSKDSSEDGTRRNPHAKPKAKAKGEKEEKNKKGPATPEGGAQASG